MYTVSPLFTDIHQLTEWERKHLTSYLKCLAEYNWFDSVDALLACFEDIQQVDTDIWAMDGEVFRVYQCDAPVFLRDVV